LNTVASGATAGMIILAMSLDLIIPKLIIDYYGHHAHADRSARIEAS
jgi:hypothetical protein